MFGLKLWQGLPVGLGLVFGLHQVILLSLYKFKYFTF